MNKAIRVLVVDDSPVARELLLQILGADPDLTVVGVARDGEEALAAIERCVPDVVTMDIEMPRMDGYEATRRIMATHPVPIVIVSSKLTPADLAATFHAVETGALAVVEKPCGPGSPGHEAMARRLVQTVKLMSEVRVVRRWNREAPTPGKPGKPATPAAPVSCAEPAERPQIVAIGASTGGPPVLQKILSGITPQFSLPILVVQHMAPGFLQGMADWLIQSTGFHVRLAANGEVLRPGFVYLAPDGIHLGVRRYPGVPGRAWLSESEPENCLRPAVSFLFRSVAEYYGESAIGVLLTGMGHDGADELKILREKGAVTIAQDKESSVVHGMPGAAIALGAARHILTPEQIVETLKRLAVSG